MKDILFDIVAHKKEEVAEFKSIVPAHKLYAQVEKLSDETLPSMRQSLLKSASGIISEFKRRSPSKGWINEAAQADVVPISYQEAGATGLSILTDDYFFGGRDEFIKMARHAGVTIPILYKNFVIDEYQLFQARLAGASVILLIAAIIKRSECKMLMKTAHELGLEVLLEMHHEQELAYAELEPDLYGINNRDLGSFHTDVQNSFRLAEKLPEDGCKVSESGIFEAQTIKLLRENGFNGFLMGEAFMKTDNPGKALSELIKQL